MPVVRATRQVTTAPLPGARRTAAETALSQGAGVAQEQARTAERIAALGGTVATLGFQRYSALVQAKFEQERESRLLSRDRQLADFELARLDDPEVGAFATEKGEKAAELLETFTTDFDRQAGQLEEGLTDAEKVAFRRGVNRRREHARARVAAYADRELVTWREQETEAGVTLAMQHAIGNADNPARVAEERERAKALIAGLPNLSRAQRVVMTVRVTSAIHAGVIESLLARGADRQAQIYFEEVPREELVPAVIPELERKLETSSTLGTAQRAADLIWTQLGPASDEDAIELDRMETLVRQQFEDEPKVLQATINALRERKAGVDAARREREEAIGGTLWRAAAAGASLEELRREPAFVKASGKVQAQLADYVVNRAEREASRAYSQEGRAFTRAQRVEAEKESRGWGRYWELADPAVLSTMSDDAIEVKRGELGDAHTNRLHELKGRLSTPDAVKAATIDDNLFKSLADSAGLQPYKTTQSEQQKARLGYLRSAVEGEIDREQVSRNRKLTRDETAAVMQRVLDREVTVGGWSGPGPLPSAMVVREQDQEAAYVPLDQIPAQNLSEWINVIRSEIPREQRATRDAILRRYRDRIQRAHAAAVLGLGPEEERRRLFGR